MIEYETLQITRRLNIWSNNPHVTCWIFDAHNFCMGPLLGSFCTRCLSLRLSRLVPNEFVRISPRRRRLTAIAFQLQHFFLIARTHG